MSKRSLASLLAIAALPLLLGVSGGGSSSLPYSFTRKAGPHAETVVGWMLRNAAGKAVEAAQGTAASHDEVLSYFALTGRSNRLNRTVWDRQGEGPAKMTALATELSPLRSELDALKPRVELSIQGQVAEALREAGLGYRVAGAEHLFPPVLFRFEALPNLLVVSPRHRIERAATVLLHPRITLAEAEQLEDSISRAGFSSMVTEIGGLGVYPSMVPEGPDVRWALRTVAHEWAHQFFALRPLGWRYAFGTEKDDRMITINETAAEILGREIGDEVYRRYYRDAPQEEARPSARGDSFRTMMREVRLGVDALLAQGRVEEAESFMEASRQTLAQRGIVLRRLNQAYFAFHGSYSDEPFVGGAEGDDIGGRLHLLRERSESVGDFAWRISGVGSYEEFRRLSIE